VANGQAGFATYTREPDGSQGRAFLQVLDIGPGGIEHVYAFVDPGVFGLFGLR
jgi:RNA polymerase sigma-70 factor (ECF subfamily)